MFCRAAERPVEGGTSDRERALVLGGGGATGNAWVIGVVAGLFDAGLDVTQADLIIGTSAGSTAAAQITSAIPSALFANILAPAPQQRTNPGGSAPAANHLQRLMDIIAAAEDAPDMRRRIGAAALAMAAASDGERQTQWRATVAARLPSPHWPQRALLITAVDAQTGEPVVFDRRSGVDLADAVAASCANGFSVLPYRIGDRRYLDGGYRANENADLAAGCARVLVLSPFSGRSANWATVVLHCSASASASCSSVTIDIEMPMRPSSSPPRAACSASIASSCSSSMMPRSIRICPSRRSAMV